MISKTLRIALTIVLAGFAFTSAAGAAQQAESASASCSIASLNGTYGFLHGGLNINAAPSNAAVSQLTFDPTAATFTGQTTTSREGVISTFSFTGTYAVASNCTGIGTPTGGNPFTFVVTPTGFLGVEPFNPATGATSEGYAVNQGAPACSNNSVKGSFALQATGIFLAGAPVTGPLSLIAQLKFTVSALGDGLISGHITGSEGTNLAFSEEPVTGSYSIATDCTGTATITPKGNSPLTFTFVVVDCGKQILAIETDADTIVSATLLKINWAAPASCHELPPALGCHAKAAAVRRDAGRRHEPCDRKLSDALRIQERITKERAENNRGTAGYA